MCKFAACAITYGPIKAKYDNKQCYEYILLLDKETKTEAQIKPGSKVTVYSEAYSNKKWTVASIYRTLTGTKVNICLMDFENSPNDEPTKCYHSSLTSIQNDPQWDTKITDRWLEERINNAKLKKGMSSPKKELKKSKKGKKNGSAMDSSLEAVDIELLASKLLDRINSMAKELLEMHQIFVAETLTKMQTEMKDIYQQQISSYSEIMKTLANKR
jgi:hypothetical protein